MNITRAFRAGRMEVTAALAAIALLAMPIGGAAAVEYVKICSLYGAGYYYVPGTDVCTNPDTYDARQQTDGGAWGWRMPNNPSQSVSSAKKACKGGTLVEVGTFPASSLVPNTFTLTYTDPDLVVHTRPHFETAPRVPVALGEGEFISSVIFQGGYTGAAVGAGNFCLFYFHHDSVNDVDVYNAIGCADTASQAAQLFATSFTADSPVPPATTDPVYLVGANGAAWTAESFSDISGSLTISACVQKAKAPK